MTCTILAQTTVVHSPLHFALFAGGVPLLAGGLVCMLWGLWNIFVPQCPRLIMSQLVLSLVPGVGAMLAVYVAAAEFIDFASAEIPPKPSTITLVVGRAISFGFVGLLSTVASVFFGVIAIRRHCVLASKAPTERSG